MPGRAKICDLPMMSFVLRKIIGWRTMRYSGR